jgi:hypothetical protein
MSDDATKTDPKEDPEKTEGDPEKGFWDKLGSLIDERVEKAFDREHEKRGTVGNSRNDGRTTLPGLIADLMYGKPKKD